MKSIRFVALATVVAAVIAPFGLSRAGAATVTPGSYQASANGDALSITVGGTQLVGGDSKAAGASTPSATATGSAQLLPTVASSQTATSTAPGTNQVLPQICATPSLPAIPAPFAGALGFGAGCGSAQSAVDSTGLPSSSSTGTVGTLNVGASGLLNQVVQSGTPIVTTLQGIFGTLPTIPVGGVSLNSLLTQLGATITSATGLVSVVAGSTTSSVTATSTSVNATSTDSGATIGLITGAGANGGPLLSVSVGAATSTSSLDKATANATAVADPGLVTVSFGTVATGVQTVTLAPGQSQTFLSGTPLESSIAVGAGAVTQGAGQAASTAHGVTLDLLQGISGGIDIDLATGSTAVAGAAPAAAVATAPVAATTTTTAAPAVVPDVTAVHTGEPWAGALPVVALAMALGLALVYRRHLLALTPAVARAGRAIGTPVGGMAHRVVARVQDAFGRDIRTGPGPDVEA